MVKKFRQIFPLTFPPQYKLLPKKGKKTLKFVTQHWYELWTTYSANSFEVGMQEEAAEQPPWTIDTEIDSSLHQKKKGSEEDVRWRYLQIRSLLPYR